ncbi:MAG TPA: crossover junction endodeoxyribonuclease RuvC [Dehalococcoidia bacterium]|nr:crossover junction endodeoxyribonuclease RuvC [Dehalococcoidia bacterium]
MKILGVDPGTKVVGYGVIEDTGSSVSMVECGALTCKASLSVSERLCILYNQLCEIVSRHQPDVVAVEQPFMGKNVASALAVGKAQAIAMLAGANRGIPVYEYTPAQIKQRVADYGASTKEQVQKMVSLQLGLSEVPEPADAADALATALCHLAEVHLENLLREQA